MGESENATAQDAAMLAATTESLNESERLAGKPAPTVATEPLKSGNDLGFSNADQEKREIIQDFIEQRRKSLELRGGVDTDGDTLLKE